ncbi:MAG: sigma-70 family RNA polymerase sigma factor [Puniceicoccales bacterium]|nr:sigma-70 family RNA polymerase sigma factor [Puniceicoccales bacterium]
MEREDGPLSLAEERHLLERVRTGDRSAREKIFLSNRLLVYRLAHRYRHLGIPLDDLIHEGFLGLHRAIDRFQPRQTIRLATYATWWVRFAIRRAIATLRGPVSLPTPLLATLHGLEKSRYLLRERLGRAPTAQELARHMHCPVTRVRTLEHVSGGTVSPREDWVESQPTPRDLATDASLLQAIREGLVSLAPLEARVLRLRYGLDGSPPLTLDAIGRRCHLDRDRVRQLTASALKKLRSSL